HQPRLVQQRALEGQALAHPTGKARHWIVGALGELGLFKRRVDDGCAILAVQPGKKREVLPRRELRVQVQLVGEQTDTSANSWPDCRRTNRESGAFAFARSVAIERSVNRLERGYQLFMPGRVAVVAGPSTPSFALEPNEVVQEAIPFRDEFLSLCGHTRSVRIG